MTINTISFKELIEVLSGDDEERQDRIFVLESYTKNEMTALKSRLARSFKFQDLTKIKDTAVFIEIFI